jgi:hypothetical protein
MASEAWQQPSWPAMDPMFPYTTDQVFSYAAAGDPTARRQLDMRGLDEYSHAVDSPAEGHLLADGPAYLPPTPTSDAVPEHLWTTDAYWHQED